MAIMNWIPLTSEQQLQQIIENSKQKPQVIFKHSIRCGISSMAKSRLERSQPPGSIDFYYLDLINYRSISNRLSEIFKVVHESPQVLLIKNGECVYEESHSGIRMEEIIEQADVF
jgi:bacillithiol system protein YtxJ